MVSLRGLLAIEAAAFAAAALIHSGAFRNGVNDPGAAIAESVIGLVLALGLVASWTAPGLLRPIALGTQAFALLGTFVGLSLLILVGPFSVVELAFHVALVAMLVYGLVVAWRS